MHLVAVAPKKCTHSSHCAGYPQQLPRFWGAHGNIRSPGYVAVSLKQLIRHRLCPVWAAIKALNHHIAKFQNTRVRRSNIQRKCTSSELYRVRAKRSCSTVAVFKDSCSSSFRRRRRIPHSLPIILPPKINNEPSNRLSLTSPSSHRYASVQTFGYLIRPCYVLKPTRRSTSFVLIASLRTQETGKEGL